MKRGLPGPYMFLFSSKYLPHCICIVCHLFTYQKVYVFPNSIHPTQYKMIQIRPPFEDELKAQGFERILKVERDEEGFACGSTTR
jgi:hypothetical protein